MANRFLKALSDFRYAHRENRIRSMRALRQRFNPLQLRIEIFGHIMFLTMHRILHHGGPLQRERIGVMLQCAE
jgi:hypothetical protein